jgi:riboflavin biosynthesis pyrimidine reductase
MTRRSWLPPRSTRPQPDHAAATAYHAVVTADATEPTFRVDRLWPDPVYDIAIDDAMASFDLPSPPADRPVVAINMVTSIDGRAQLHGTAEGLGSRADRRLMRLYRAEFDAVGSGVGTLRASGVWLRVGDDLEARRVANGQPPNPIGVVIAGSDRVPIDERWFAGDESRILFVGRENPLRETPDGTELVRAADPRPDPRWVLDALHERGIRSFLLEGGPTVNAGFLDAGLIDEMYWTIGPHVLASDALPMVTAIERADDAELRPAQLVSVHRHDHELFLRYRLVPAAAGKE